MVEVAGSIPVSRSFSPTTDETLKEVIPVSDVLVVNADLGPLHRVSLQHAIRMLVRQVAELHDFEPDRVIGIFPMPKVVRLVRYVYTKWRHTSGPGWSRQGVMARDGRRCGYCRGSASTVDHIQPRSRGGRNSWKNTVAACGPCNQRKADRTPAEAGMALLVTPSTPTWASIAHR
jgi:5-methylcytosine-specific restriction endonuclease McrA